MSGLDKQRVIWLVILASISAAIYYWIQSLSSSFAPGSVQIERPIRMVLFLLAVAFVVYVAASVIATKLPSGPTVWILIFLPAIIFRCLMLWSHPIQEIDINRYLWDGAVAHAGVSPFKYSPDTVKQAAQQGIAYQAQLPADLQKLVELTRTQPTLATAVSRIGYSHLRTIYPPVSQFVFSIVDAFTPNDASIEKRINYMRVALILFELASIGFVILLLRCTELSDGWATLYAWCPLLIKETANSGHLDAITVFLMLVAIWLTMKMLFSKVTNDHIDTLLDPGFFWSIAAALGFAVAIAGKLFPFILIIWFIAACIWRLGLLRSLVPILLVFMASWFLLRPILPDAVALRSRPLEPQQQNQKVNDDGLTTFLTQWEMNDFLFLIPHENLKDQSKLAENNRAWFVVLPDSARQSLINWAVKLLGTTPELAPFVISRVFLGSIFAILAVVFAAIAFRSWDAIVWLRMAFLTIAWFWLLCPTQNPWYWSWALPLLAFARCRTWWLMAGIVMFYYLRFWLKYHFTGVGVAGTSYQGTVFFDLVFTWFEYVPWFLLLMVESFRANWIADSVSQEG